MARLGHDTGLRPSWRLLTIAGMIAALVVAASIIDGYAGLIAPHQRSKTMTERRDMPEPALHIAAAILQRDFSEMFGVETIERFLTSCYDQLAARATVMTYLPLLAERFARQRLNAVARLEGWIRDCKPTVLFLCTHNAGRSQMARGFFTHLAGERAVAWSGGSEPSNEIDGAAIEAMAEVGIDITEEFPKPWTDEVVRAADVVITMGCGDACPIYPGKRYEEWTLPDPAGQSLDAVRPIRDSIEEHIRRLLGDLRLPADG